MTDRGLGAEEHGWRDRGELRRTCGLGIETKFLQGADLLFNLPLQVSWRSFIHALRRAQSGLKDLVQGILYCALGEFDGERNTSLISEIITGGAITRRRTGRALAPVTTHR